MRFHTTPAIVLSSINYGESDAIVNFYTQDYGRLGGIAKGARRSRRRFGGTLEPFSYGRLIFVKKGELVRVDQWDILQGFHGIRMDLERIAYGSYLLELVSTMLKEGQRNQKVFSLLLNTLSILEERKRPEVLTRAFEMRLLTVIGYQPCLDRCVVCKQTFMPSITADALGGRDGKTIFFSSAKGGILCPGCASPLIKSGAGMGGGLVPITTGTASVLILMVRLGLTRIAHLSIPPLMLREGEQVLEDFIRYQLGKELKSKRFLKCISRM